MNKDFELLQADKWNNNILTNIFVMFFVVIIIIYELYFNYMNNKEMEYLNPYFFLMLLILFPMSWLISYVKIYNSNSISSFNKGYIIFLIVPVLISLIIEIFNTTIEIITKERKRSKHKDNKFEEEAEDKKEETTSSTFINYCKNFIDSNLPLMKGIDKATIRYIIYLIYGLICTSTYYAYHAFGSNEQPSFTQGIGWLLSQPFNLLHYFEDSFIKMFEIINISHLLKVFIIFSIAFITILFSFFISFKDGNLEIYNIPNIINNELLDNLFTYDTVFNVISLFVLIISGIMSYPFIKEFNAIMPTSLKILLIILLAVIFLFSNASLYIPFVSYFFINTESYNGIVATKLMFLLLFLLVCLTTPIILFILQLLTETGIAMVLNTLNVNNILYTVASAVFFISFLLLFSSSMVNEWYKDNEVYKLIISLIITISVSLLFGFSTQYKVFSTIIRSLYNIVMFLVVPFAPILLLVISIIRMIWKYRINKSSLKKTDG